jgi:predicted Zn finger-like uncharacterized protein
LYTQCIKCETVFRLSAEVLRAAGGQVRCGRCGEVFNALARLAEDPSAFPTGESSLEMETRANQILESAVPPLQQPGKSSGSSHEIIEIEDFDSNDVDVARLQLVDKFVEDMPPPAKSASVSADVKAPPIPPRAAPAPSPPATANPKPAPAAPPRAPAPAAATTAAAARARAPVAAPASASASRRTPATVPTPEPTSAPAPAPAAASTAASTAIPPARAGEPLLDDGSMEFTLPPGELDRVFVERLAQSRQSPNASKSLPNGTVEEGEAAAEPEPPSDLVGGFEVPEGVRQEMLSGIAQPAPPEFPGSPRRSIPFSAWLGTSILLALLLCAQLIHGNREWIGTHAPLHGSLHGLYAALGIAVGAPANLSAYQLRQWGVTGDPSANGTLRVRASILNTAAQLQPYPLLRVTLANRFGTKIGARDFEPAEYMGKPIVRMLAPGERADATLDIVDPGKDAEGFEIDVCVRGADQKISCTGDVATQAKQ